MNVVYCVCRAAEYIASFILVDLELETEIVIFFCSSCMNKYCRSEKQLSCALSLMSLFSSLLLPRCYGLSSLSFGK